MKVCLKLYNELINHNKRKIILIAQYLLSFVLASFAMICILLSSHLIEKEHYIFIIGDSLEQYVGDIRMLARSVLNNESFFFQFSSSMGLASILPVALEGLSPFNLLFILFYRADVAIVAPIVIVLKTGLIGACFFFYSKKVLKANSFSALLTSVFYSLCAFSVIYGTISFFWLDALYIIPLCSIAINKAVYEKRNGLLIFTFSYALISQFYMGYLIGIFGCIYYILLIIFGNHRFGKGEIINNFFRFLLSSIISLLIAAIVWVPVIFFLLKYNVSDRTSFNGFSIDLLTVFNNFFWGEMQDLRFAPYIYCGIPCLLLFPFYFINGKIDRKEKLVYGILFIVYLLGFIFNPLYQLFHGFDAPDSFNYRFSFILSFIVCSITCKQISQINRIKNNYLLLWVIGLILLYIFIQRIQSITIGALSANDRNGLFINIAFILVWIIMYYLYNRFHNRKGIHFILVIIILIAFIETVSNGYKTLTAHNIVEDNGVLKNDYKEWKAEYAEMLGLIESDNNDFYRVVVFDDLIHNSDTYWGYNGVSDFCTAENQQLRNTMSSLGLYTSPRSTYSTGVTPVTEMVLSVKYIARMKWEENQDSDKKVELVTNEYWLPIGYMANKEVLSDFPFGQNVFENQNELIYSLTGVDGVFKPVDMNQVEVRGDGLFLSANNEIAGKPNCSMTFIVDEASEPVFLQIEPKDNDIAGLYYDHFDNMTCSVDTLPNISFSAQLNSFKEKKYISLWSDELFGGSFSTAGIHLYELDEDKMNRAYNSLNSNTLWVEEFRNGYIKGKIKVDNTEKVLMTSIPLVEGWKAKINGKDVKPIAAVNNTFMTFSFAEKGEYTVELVYSCPGMRLGIILSAVGFLLLGVYSVIIYKNRKTKESINA